MARASTAASKENKGSVISVMRGINVTDAPMYSWLPGDRFERIYVVRQGIRGTQNVAAEKSVSNPQITETAKTSPEAIGLRIEFSIQPVPLRKLIVACDQPDERARIERFLTRAERSEELMELCRRYARRILSGSFFWRNLTLAKELEIEVRCGTGKVRVQGEQSFDLAARGFRDYTDAEVTLAQWLRNAFVTTDNIGDGIHVDARLRFENLGAMEVYPSQVYVQKKPTGFARPLYKLESIPMELMERGNDDNPRTFLDSIPTGWAALRDQKIGNAIRTIDTWYDEGAELPIPVEPNGAYLTNNKFFREYRSGKSFFDLRSRLDQLTDAMKESGSSDAPSPEAMFMLAVFIRGGVLGDTKE